MFALRAVRTTRAAWGRRGYAQFIGSGVCSMPRNRVSAGEKMLLTTIMFGSWFPYPIWVLWNIEYYKRAPGAPLDS